MSTSYSRNGVGGKWGLESEYYVCYWRQWYPIQYYSTDGGERTLWSFRLFFLKMGGARVYEALRTQCLRRFLVPEFLQRDDDSAAFSGLFKVLKI